MSAECPFILFKCTWSTPKIDHMLDHKMSCNKLQGKHAECVFLNKCPLNVHILKAWYPRWCYWRAVEPLEAGVYWGRGGEV
jgi:hypothetical protein